MTTPPIITDTDQRWAYLLQEARNKISRLSAECSRLNALLNDPVRLRKYIEQQMDDEAERVSTQFAENDNG